MLTRTKYKPVCLFFFFSQFTHDNHPPPPTRNSIELLSVAQARLKELMDDLDGVDLFIKKMDMEEENFVPTGFTEVEQETQDGDEDSTKRLTQLKQRPFFPKIASFQKMTTRRMTWIAGQTMRKCRREGISSGRPTSLWMPKAGPREETGGDNRDR